MTQAEITRLWLQSLDYLSPQWRVYIHPGILHDWLMVTFVGTFGGKEKSESIATRCLAMRAGVTNRNEMLEGLRTVFTLVLVRETPLHHVLHGINRNNHMTIPQVLHKMEDI